MSWIEKNWKPLTVVGGLLGLSWFAGKRFEEAETFDAEWRGRWNVGDLRQIGWNDDFTFYLKKDRENVFSVQIKGRNRDIKRSMDNALKQPIFRFLKDFDRLKIGSFYRMDMPMTPTKTITQYVVHIPQFLDGAFTLSNFSSAFTEQVGIIESKDDAVGLILWSFREPYTDDNDRNDFYWELKNYFGFAVDTESPYDNDYGAETFEANGMPFGVHVKNHKTTSTVFYRRKPFRRFRGSRHKEKAESYAQFMEKKIKSNPNRFSYFAEEEDDDDEDDGMIRKEVRLRIDEEGTQFTPTWAIEKKIPILYPYSDSSELGEIVEDMGDVAEQYAIDNNEDYRDFISGYGGRFPSWLSAKTFDAEVIACDYCEKTGGGLYSTVSLYKCKEGCDVCSECLGDNAYNAIQPYMEDCCYEHFNVKPTWGAETFESDGGIQIAGIEVIADDENRLSQIKSIIANNLQNPMGKWRCWSCGETYETSKKPKLIVMTKDEQGAYCGCVSHYGF